MKLELTKEQYKNLIKLVSLGNVMANMFRDEDERIDKLERAASDFLEQAAKSGLGDYVKKCGCGHCDGVYGPSDKLWDDPDMVMVQDEYDDDVFWEQLVDRLAERDMRLHYGVKAIARMSEAERDEKTDAYLRRYDDEIDEHGVDRLVIREEK